MLAGVCGGIAEYLNIDSALVRLFTLLLVFAGIGVPAYIVAWIIVPEEPLTGEENKEESEAHASQVRKNTGILIIIIGIILLIGQFFPNWDLFKLWPLVLILIGIYLLKETS